MDNISAYYRGRQFDGPVAAVNQFEVQLFSGCEAFVPVHKEQEALGVQDFRSVNTTYRTIVVAVFADGVRHPEQFASEGSKVGRFLEENSPFRRQFDFAGTNTSYIFIAAEIADEVGEPVALLDKGIRVHRDEKPGIAVFQTKVQGSTMSETTTELIGCRATLD